MKRLMLCVVVLAIVASMSFALEVGGSTTTGVAGNKDEQRIEVAQEIDIDLGILHIDVDGEVDYDLPVKETFWEYEIGASVPVSVFTFGGSFGGDKDVKLGNLTAYADIVFESVGADVDFLFSADEDKDVFQGAEFSAFVNPGPCEFRVGYMWTEHGEPDVNVPEDLASGGLYFKAKVSY